MPVEALKSFLVAAIGVTEDLHLAADHLGPHSTHRRCPNVHQGEERREVDARLRILFGYLSAEQRFVSWGGIALHLREKVFNACVHRAVVALNRIEVRLNGCRSEEN